MSVTKQVWEGAEDDLKIASVHKGKLQPLRLKQLPDSARDGFLTAYLLTTHRAPRVALTLEEGAGLRHLAQKNIPANMVAGSPEWVDVVERMAGVFKLAKLEQMEKMEMIDDQPNTLDVTMTNGQPWAVQVARALQQIRDIRLCLQYYLLSTTRNDLCSRTG